MARGFKDRTEPTPELAAAIVKFDEHRRKVKEKRQRLQIEATRRAALASIIRAKEKRNGKKAETG